MRFLAKVFGIADVSSKLAKGPRSCESQKSGLSSLPSFFGIRPTRNKVMKGCGAWVAISEARIKMINYYVVGVEINIQVLQGKHSSTSGQVFKNVWKKIVSAEIQ